MKRKAKQTLTHRLVMVDPDLTTDPVNRQGEIGIISSLFPDDSAAFVVFKDGQKGAYQLEGLITLYPKTIIWQRLTDNHAELSYKNHILKVYQFLSENKKEEALKQSMISEETRFYCTTNYRNWLDLKKEQSKKMRKSPGKR